MKKTLLFLLFLIPILTFTLSSHNSEQIEKDSMVVNIGNSLVFEFSDTFAIAATIRIDAFTNDTAIEDSDEFIIWSAGDAAGRNVLYSEIKSNTDTLTNKTIDDDNNTISNIDGENISDNTIDDDSIDLSTGAGLSASDMPDEDVGDISISTGSWTLDSGVVDATAISDNSVSLSDVTHTDTLAGNLALAASQCYWASTGIICEGSTADTIETLLTFTDPTSTDKTITFPNATDTLVGKATTDTLTNKTIDGDDNTLQDIAISQTKLVAGTNITLATDTLNVDDAFILNTGDTMAGKLFASKLAITDLDCTGNTNGGALTADASGNVSCSDDDGGAGGGGDNATVNSTAVDTTANFLDNAIIEFDVADGGAGGPDDITGTLATGGVGQLAIATGGVATAEILDGTIVDADMANDALDADKIVGDSTDDDDLDVAAGGTGVSTLTDGGILLGSGTGDITALGVASNGQIPIGDGTTDPQLATITGDDGITVTNGAASIELDVTPVTSGGDADSSTTQSDSGLEIVGNELTMLRGCSDNQILKWDETQDDWNCEADGGSGSGDEATVNSTAIDTTANFLDNVVIEFDVADGGAGGPDDVTGTLATDGVGHVALNDSDTPADEECLTYEGSDDSFEWQSCGGGSGTGVMPLPVQSAKISGDFIVDGTMQIDAGEGDWRLLADDSAHEYAGWQFRVPSTFTSGPVAKILYRMTSATANDIDLEVDMLCDSDGEENSAFDTINEIAAGTDVPGTAGLLDSISLTLTNNDSMAAGDLCFLRIGRDFDDSDDAATGDVEIVGVTLEWTE